MKKIFIVLSVAILALFQISCAEELEVKPTDRVSGDGMMDNTNTAIVALNGVYRIMLITPMWGGAEHESFGPQSYSLMADLMGEDMAMKAMGNGWFWYDYLYDVKSYYTTTNWRPYDVWNFFYTIISNVNYIIDAEETMQGATEDVNYIIGQAYALRAYSYHYLALSYCRTFKGHESDKGVPLYTKPTVAGTEGAPRGTLEDVYRLINEDIEKAVTLLADAPAQTHSSHIDYRGANLIKARINMYTDEWDTVLAAAQEAQKPFKGQTYQVGNAEDVLGGFNDRTKRNIVWAAEIIQDQSTTNPQFFSHMDAYGGSAYASGAPKTINPLLYDKMSGTDIRRAWWNPDDNRIADGGSTYQQMKFKFADVPNWLGDRINMRIEEAVLMEAEALCRRGRDGEAITALMKLMSKRDPEYTTSKSGTSMGALTTDETGSLLEEIIIQRRIELWGEYGRVWDIRRLKQGFVRTAAMGHPEGAINATNAIKVNNTETWDWVLTIPQKEFDGNINMNQTVDQNPMDSGI
jgi:hypothetical protein